MKNHKDVQEELLQNSELRKAYTLEVINHMIQEIKQDPSISISQRNYAIKKMEELKKKL